MAESTGKVEEVSKSCAILCADLRISNGIVADLKSDGYLKALHNLRGIASATFSDYVPLHSQIFSKGITAAFSDDKQEAVYTSFKAAMQLHSKWKQNDNNMKLGIALHMGDITLIQTGNGIAAVKGEEIKVANDLEKLTKQAKREPFFFSESFRNTLDTYGIIQHLRIVRHSFHHEIVGYDTFDAYEVNDLSSTQIERIGSLLDAMHGERRIRYVTPVKSWIDLYKQLDEPEIDYKDPENAFYKALFDIFQTFGFDIRPGASVGGTLTIPFKVVTENGSIAITVLERFNTPASTHQMLGLLVEKRLGRVLFIVSDQSSVDESMQIHFVPNYNVKNIIFTPRELKYLHALYVNVPAIKDQIFTQIFYSENDLVNLGFVENLRYSLLYETLMERIEELKEVFSDDHKLLHMIDNPETAIRDIGDEVSNNHPIIAQKILRYNNSALSGQGKTQDIVTATIRNGANLVRSILYEEMARKLVPETFPGYGIVPDAYLFHCKALGIFCDLLAKRLNLNISYNDSDRRRIDNFYSLGFLHDIGICLLDQAIQQFYRDIILEGGKQYFTFQENEKRHKIYHAEWSNIVLGKCEMKDGSRAWALPLPIIEGIYYHHKPYATPVDKDPSTKKVACMIYVGECLFECYHLNTEAAYREAQIHFDECLSFLGLDFSDVMALRNETETVLGVI